MESNKITKLEQQLRIMRAQGFPATECWELWCRIETMREEAWGKIMSFKTFDGKEG